MSCEAVRLGNSRNAWKKSSWCLPNCSIFVKSSPPAANSDYSGPQSDGTMMSIRLCLLLGSLLGSGRSLQCSTMKSRSLHVSPHPRLSVNSCNVAIFLPPWLENQTVKGINYQETAFPEDPASLLWRSVPVSRRSPPGLCKIFP